MSRIFRKINLSAATVGLLVIGLSGCGDEGSRSDFASQMIDNNAILQSSSLTSLSLMSSTCDNDETRCTPTNLEGDVCYAIYMMGELGGESFSGYWLWPESVSDPEEGLESGTCSATTFNLGTSTSFNASVQIPESSGEMPTVKDIIRVELAFNYVDATVTINNGTLNDTYTIRTVYASTADESDADDTMVQGDKLVKASGASEFSWCNSSGCNTSRSAVSTGIIQDATVTEYEFPSGGGNTDYIPVTANFGENGANAVTVTYDQMANTDLTWTLDFDLSSAIVWSESPSNFTNVQDMVDAFRLKFGPNQSTTNGETDDGIQATISIE